MAPRRHRARRAVAAVELALVLPFLLALLVGIWEIGRLCNAQQIMSNAAREGGRSASVGTLSGSQVQTLVTAYLATAGLPTQNATVTITNTTSGADPTAAAQFDRFTISIAIPISDLRWSMTGQFAPAGNKLIAEASWVSMKNKDYPSPTDPPVNY